MLNKKNELHANRQTGIPKAPKYVAPIESGCWYKEYTYIGTFKEPEDIVILSEEEQSRVDEECSRILSGFVF